MRVLLSINPVHAEKIFSGVKRFEYRKSLFKRNAVRTVVVYVTRPVARIVGEFDVETILGGSPQYIWKMTEKYSGITEKFFFEYYEGRETAFAIAVGQVRAYPEAINPWNGLKNFTPPQSFQYLDDDFTATLEQQLTLFPADACSSLSRRQQQRIAS